MQEGRVLRLEARHRAHAVRQQPHAPGAPAWLQARQVLLHTDSSILAEQLSQARPRPIARLHPIYEQARALLPLFEVVRVQWIPRHKNTVADALARGDETAPTTMS